MFHSIRPAGTRTIVEEQGRAPTLVLRLGAPGQPSISPWDQALGILASIRASGRFASEEENLRKIEHKFIEAQAAFDIEGFCFVLCHLLCQIIQPKEESIFEENIKQLLLTTLPEGKPIGVFINSYKRSLKELELLTKTERLRASMLASANETNRFLEKTFRQKKAEVAQVHATMKDAFRKQQEAIQKLAQRSLSAAKETRDLAEKGAEA
jgi:hypothetical protein